MLSSDKSTTTKPSHKVIQAHLKNCSASYDSTSPRPCMCFHYQTWFAALSPSDVNEHHGMSPAILRDWWNPSDVIQIWNLCVRTHSKRGSLVNRRRLSTHCAFCVNRFVFSSIYNKKNEIKHGRIHIFLCGNRAKDWHFKGEPNPTPLMIKRY